MSFRNVFPYRAMNGIPPLVELLRYDYPEVLKNALGALKNMSCGGRTENKVSCPETN